MKTFYSAEKKNEKNDVFDNQQISFLYLIHLTNAAPG